MSVKASANYYGVKSGIQTDTLENVDTEGNYYAGEFAAIPERDAMELTAVSDTAIYYLKYDQLNDMRETLMRYDSESGQITELTDAIPEGSSIQKLCVNSEGHPMVITIGRKKEGEDQSICYRLIEMDENVNQIMDKEHTGLLEETEVEGYLQYLKAGPDGRIYLGAVQGYGYSTRKAMRSFTYRQKHGSRRWGFFRKEN